MDAAGRCYKNRLNQSANPSPLIREGPAQNVPAWSEHGPLMVGGMGRAALYLKVSPNGLWPAARSRPVAGFKGCRPVPPTPPLGASPGFFLFWQRLLAGSGLLACWLARSLACLLVFSAFPGRARLPTASTNQRSAIWKVDSNRSPGRNQQEQLRVQRAWRPHSLRCSEHEPKECAGSLLRRGRVPNVAFESNMQQSYRCRGSGQPQKLRFPRFSRPLVCPQRAPTKGVRRQQKGKGKKPKECAEKEKKEEKRPYGRAARASALKTVPCRCSSAV